MNEEPTEFDRAEFDSIARELTGDTYAIIGKSITAWSTTEGILVTIAAMLLDTGSEKAGLVSYSINTSTHAYRSSRSCSPLTRSSRP